MIDNNNKDDNEDERVVSLERFRTQRHKQEEQSQSPTPVEPLLNLTPGVKWLAGLILFAFLILEAVSAFIEPGFKQMAYILFGFIPAQWTSVYALDMYSLFSPLTFNFLHGGWLHVGMNVVMLVAFGTGVEQVLGAKRLWILFFLTSITGAAAHTVFNPDSTMPIIGASAGVSGLFGVVILVMQARGMLGNGPSGLWPFIILWIGISVFFGLFSPVDGNAKIAWIAHIGGFLGGIGFMQMSYFRRSGK